MEKPLVICHMMSTVNGKIIAANWGQTSRVNQFRKAYETIHDTFDSDAWICGRVTMEKDFSKGRQPDLTASAEKIPRSDFIAEHGADSFAIAVDPTGKLGWEKSTIDDDHIIEVLTEKVADAYLLFLQEKKISYIFCGKDAIDFNNLVTKLGSLFGIKRLMLEGGGHLNGSFINAGLIDELSILLLPLADGIPGTASAFEITDPAAGTAAVNLQLTGLKQLEEGVIWASYKVDR